MKKRLLSLILCGLMTASLLVGCATDSEELKKSQQAQNGGNSSQEDSGSQTASDTFTIAINSDTGNTLNPMTDSARFTLMTCNMVYSPLYRMNTDGSIDYILAESMEASEDGLVYTFKLKEGLKWSDGEPLTAADVVYTYNAENEAYGTFYIDGQPIQVTNPDDNTVVFTLPSVAANILEMLGNECFILPKHIFENRGSFDINMLEEEIVGAGPYTLKEYKTGQHLHFVKNPNYVLGEAKTENVVYKIIEKDDTAALALQNGDINAWIGAADTIGPFQNENYNITNYSEGRVAYLTLNSSSPKMADKNYRTGILKALNREEIMTAAYTDSEYYVLGYSFLPAENQYYTEDLEKYEQDVEEAKKLVAGGATELTIGYVRTDIVQEKMALAVQAELKAVGINVTLEGFEQAAAIDIFAETENTPYDIFLGGYVMGIDPYAYATLFVSDQEGMMNMIKYDNETINKLFVEGNATLDEAARQEIYTQVQQEVAGEAYFYPLGTNLRTLVTSANVGGIEEAKTVAIYTFSDWSKITVK